MALYEKVSLANSSRRKLASVPERTERAWAAGFFDGEGCFTYSQFIHKQTGRLRFVMCSQAPQVIEGEAILNRLKNALGGLGIVRYLNNRRSPCWRWDCNSLGEIQTVAGIMWPYLGPVKQRAFIKMMKAYAQFVKDKVEEAAKLKAGVVPHEAIAA